MKLESGGEADFSLSVGRFTNGDEGIYWKASTCLGAVERLASCQQTIEDG